jgi:hypothetical protein
LGVLTINGTGITTTLAASLTLNTNATTTLTSGTLDLGGFTLTTGIFSSTASTTRSIAFGTGTIALTHTTAATTVLSMATATGFTWTGTGGFTSTMSVTRTFAFGSTAGGSATNSPNLTLISGVSIPTITNGSWFNTLTFETPYSGTVSSESSGVTILNQSGHTFTIDKITLYGIK